MRLKELQSLMQDFEPFSSPKIELEQYPTGAHLASRLLFTVDSMFDEFQGRTVIDLGCGTGMLAIGAAALGACHVLGVDIDTDALEAAQSNCDGFDEPLPIDLLQVDVSQLGGTGRAPLRARADVVIMNPPFGTRRKGADVEFLRAAFRVARTSVYSLHKSSTRKHIQRVAVSELGAASAEVLAELRYDLPASYAFHKQKSRDIQVDLWRFVLQ